MTNSASSLPDFFLLGTAKSGTTSLHHYLRQHPALFLPYVKELNFFDADEETFSTGLDRYLRYFPSGDDRCTGEATPSYFRRTDVVPDRMRQLYGSSPPLFLVLFRDPVQRAYSHYLHNVAEGREPLSFEKALQAEQAEPDAKRRAWKGYFTDGVYADSLAVWFDQFPRDRFLILLSEELEHRTDGILQTVFRFLGVDPTVEIDTETRLNRTGEQQSKRLGALLSYLPSGVPNLVPQWLPESTRLAIEQFIRRWSTGSASDRPTLDPEIERTLRERYEPQVDRLSRMIDRDLSTWRPA